MRGGSPKPIARPMRTMSDFLAPTTCDIRSGVTRGQLRHTKAWSRAGKCGSDTGVGALPIGRSAAEGAESFAPTFAQAGEKYVPSASPPSTAELVLINLRREQVRNRSFMLNPSLV